MAHQKIKDPKLMFVSRSLEHICFEQSALEKTSASFENRLILKIEEIKGVIKISEFCDGLLRFYGLTKALSVLNMATKTLLIPLPLAKFQRLYKRPFIPRAGGVNAEVVTKRETMTIGEIFSYIGQESAKDALFECTATIDDVVHGSSWYYIACSGCHSKVSKGPTSLLCTNKKCGKVNVSGVPQYLSKISVYDNSDQAVFVLLGDAGRELTGKPASELVKSYFEANGNEGVSHEAPVPKALISTIDTPPATVSSEGSKTTATSEETSENRVDLADGSKRTCYSSEMERAKSPKCGN
ncbi:hypothetical protein F2Q70_00023071 [Brassica cretica]|uniref:Replication factor A C-terminal domain-containing protein n=1 Tax=Brassica cretica TaxID=69181 RepID=A0A8S9GV44_BRACR|nr:hypothetical protein F2Q70_00023071 [Brassica cretica]